MPEKDQETKLYNREEVATELREILDSYGDYVDGEVAYWAEKRGDMMDADKAERRIIALFEKYIPFP